QSGLSTPRQLPHHASANRSRRSGRLWLFLAFFVSSFGNRVVSRAGGRSSGMSSWRRVRPVWGIGHLWHFQRRYPVFLRTGICQRSRDRAWKFTGLAAVAARSGACSNAVERFDRNLTQRPNLTLRRRHPTIKRAAL